MKDPLENMDSILAKFINEEAIKRADELDFDSCEYWQSITNEKIAEMSQEEHDDFRIWVDATMVFNFRFIRDERKRLVESNASKDAIKKHDDKTYNMLMQIGELLNKPQNN